MTPSLLAERIDRATSTEALDEAAGALWQLNAQNGISDAASSDLSNAIEEKREQLRARRANEVHAAKTPPGLTEVPLSAEESDSVPPKPPGKQHKSKKGFFFAVDLAGFRCAAAGGLNSAVCHLVMARGTGRDNRRTQWSVHAIEQRTGISRPNAQKAVQDLLDRGVWKKTRGGKHPKYTAVPGNKIAGGPFSTVEQAAITAIRENKTAAPEMEDVAEMLVARGLARWLERPEIELDPAALAALSEPKLIWLPNTLIDGAANEVPPIELLRQTRSLPALQLLIDLYAVQFLPHFGGVPRTLLKGTFDRQKLGEFEQFVIWGYRFDAAMAHCDIAKNFFTGRTVEDGDRKGSDEGWERYFWPALRTLVDLGLVERVGMLLDGDDDDAEIIHPFPLCDGEPDERELAKIAVQAVKLMLPRAILDRPLTEDFFPVPVPMHIRNATLVEVYRLRYRPHTSATADWYARMKKINQYRELLTANGQPEQQNPDAISKVNQSGMKANSTLVQGTTKATTKGGSTGEASTQPTKARQRGPT